MLRIKVGYKYRNLSLQVCLLPSADVMDIRGLFHNQSGECQQNLIGLQFNFNYVCPLGSIYASACASAGLKLQSGSEEGKTPLIPLSDMY